MPLSRKELRFIQDNIYYRFTEGELYSKQQIVAILGHIFTTTNTNFDLAKWIDGCNNPTKQMQEFIKQQRNK